MADETSPVPHLPAEPVVFSRNRAEATQTLASLRAWRSFIEGSARLHAHIEQTMRRAAGIHEYDFHILLALAEVPGGRMRLGDLADKLIISPSALTYRLNKLIAAGLVERVPSPDDGRVALAQLTDAGWHAFIAARDADRVEVERHFLAHLEPGDAAVITRLFDRVSDSLRPLSDR
ncbi:MAG: MarR family transcriptional regulator [Actinomycetaceae bacterium]|nr:MarR family transcriptional regulator [Actinomycetaceae bacterium]MDU0971137.1 MarR family transcriptional regulator [Actinomycetaceae bacterium]